VNPNSFVSSGHRDLTTCYPSVTLHLISVKVTIRKRFHSHENNNCYSPRSRGKFSHDRSNGRNSLLFLGLRANGGPVRLFIPPNSERPELTKAAATQGLQLSRLCNRRATSTSLPIRAGQCNTVVYQLLADAGSSPVQATAPTAGAGDRVPRL